MLRDAYLNESVWLLDHVGNNFYLAGQSFYQFCRDFCQLNEPIRQFRVILDKYNEQLKMLQSCS